MVIEMKNCDLLEDVFMQKCKVYHTGVYEFEEAVIKDNKVYICGNRDKLYYPEEMFMAREECEEGLIQLAVNGKWGFADIYSGEIKIKPTWDFVDPFYFGYAHVVLNANANEYSAGRFEVTGGKHGYINKNGDLVIPVEYDGAEIVSLRGNFLVSKDGKWGVVDKNNKVLIPFEYDYLRKNYDDDLVFGGKRVLPKPSLEQAIKQNLWWDYGIKWGVFDKQFNIIVMPELDKMPYICEVKYDKDDNWSHIKKKYYILKRKRRYGVLCVDGRLITDVSLLKRDAVYLVKVLSD